MNCQTSIEVLVSIFLALLIALSVSFLLAEATPLYYSDLAAGRSYVLISNQSLAGLEGLCGCYKVR